MYTYQMYCENMGDVYTYISSSIGVLSSYYRNHHCPFMYMYIYTLNSLPLCNIPDMVMCIEIVYTSTHWSS